MNDMEIFSIEEEKFLNTMRENINKQNDPFVGIFWYDKENDELFGIVRESPENIPFNINGIRTEKTLHKDFWKKQFENQVKRKESGRKIDNRFFVNYKNVPRGRIFQSRDRVFQIATGDWVDEYPWIIEDIIGEFNLKNCKIENIRKEHWDLGYGWSE